MAVISRVRPSGTFTWNNRSWAVSSVVEYVTPRSSGTADTFTVSGEALVLFAGRARGLTQLAGIFSAAPSVLLAGLQSIPRAVTEAAREVIETLRQEIAAGSLDASAVELAVGGLAVAVERRLRKSLAPSL